MLYSSVYNLFALIGRKAPFTHIVTVSSLTFLLSYSIISLFSVLFSSIYNLYAFLGRKASFIFNHYIVTEYIPGFMVQILIVTLLKNYQQ